MLKTANDLIFSREIKIQVSNFQVVHSVSAELVSRPGHLPRSDDQARIHDDVTSQHVAAQIRQVSLNSIGSKFYD